MTKEIATILESLEYSNCNGLFPSDDYRDAKVTVQRWAVRDQQGRAEETTFEIRRD